MSTILRMRDCPLSSSHITAGSAPKATGTLPFIHSFPYIFSEYLDILGFVLGLGDMDVLSCFSCVQLFATPWTDACQAPLSM